MRERKSQAAASIACCVPAAAHLLRRRRYAGSLIAAVLAIVAPVLPATAQSEKLVEPYARIDHSKIDYHGPGRGAADDLPGPEIRIGILAPLQGPQKEEGESLLAAARLAVEDESAIPFPGGRRLALAVRNATGLWGRASSEIVHLVFDDQAVALLTFSDGRAAHLAEQVGNRVGVPVLTLASDSTTTEINIPWLFRVVPNDTAQARAFAEDIYRRCGLRKVLLVTERGHDGRVGGDEFDKAAGEYRAPVPTHLQIPVPLPPGGPWLAEVSARAPEAVVLWTGPETAARVLEAIRRSKASPVFYVCRKALEKPFTSLAKKQESGNIWYATTRAGNSASSADDFAERYRARTGTAPSLEAAEVYDAVRLAAAALRHAGPNRARLRDSLARVLLFRGVAGNISFDGAGNNQAPVGLVTVP
jgi:branched-chain amino acid transport system substrate-binding protein